MSLDELIQAANQLDETDLDQFLQQVVTLRARRKSTVIEAQEALLLEQINQAIPTDLRQQYQSLRTQREAETLTDSDHHTLIQLSKQIEAFGVRRLEALAQLAQLRQVSLLALMQTLGIPSVTYE
jgi:uncharacterized coiled-coil DUF342 family protein